jgi:hypothetical protein
MMTSIFGYSLSNLRRPVATHLFTAVADFSKYISKARAKRQPLTTKRAGKGYYKGNRCRKEGTINSKGKFNQCDVLKTYLAEGLSREVVARCDHLENRNTSVMNFSE